jgi:ribosomal protein S18 acetylase RimI-like enzyme
MFRSEMMILLMAANGDQMSYSAGGWELGTVALHVDEENVPAVALYKRKGFVEVSRDAEWRRWLPGSKGLRILMAKDIGRERKPEARWDATRNSVGR